MKKLISLFLCISMLIGLLSGCASTETTVTEPTTEPNQTAEVKPTEKPAGPAATVQPEISNEDIVAALNVDEDIKPELVRALEFGFPLENAEKETVSGVELVELLDIFVEMNAPERLDEWKEKYKVLRYESGALKRLDAMAGVTLAADFVGGDYAKITSSPWYAAQKLNQDWSKDYLYWALFGGFEDNSQIDLGGMIEPCPLDGAAYNFSLGRVSLINGKTLFTPNEEFTSMRIEDNCTYAEALLAMVRLIDSNVSTAVIPEEIKPELLEKAVALGITDQAMADRAEEIITRKEMIDIIANVHTLRLGEESRYLIDISELMPEKQADRLWFVTSVFYSVLEYRLDLKYNGWLDWMHLVPAYENAYFAPGAVLTIRASSDGNARETGFLEYAIDASLLNAAPPEGMEEVAQENRRFDLAAAYVTEAADRFTGEKVLDLQGVPAFNAEMTMTIGETIQAALRYYNHLESPSLTACEDMGDYDHSIITDDLLSKKTALPDASCEYLPDNWRGVLVGNLAHASPYMMGHARDKVLLEGDLDVIKEAGFNFIGLMVDFAWLQGVHPEEGKLSEERLQIIDQIIARCIERDIHVDLRCNGVGDQEYTVFGDEWFNYQTETVNGTAQIDNFASYWGALARRYKDIPNVYLSFNLMVETTPNSEKEYERFFTPAVNAIREYTPDRCIIADVHAANITGESMAKLGVALSYHQYDPRDFSAYDSRTSADKDYLASVTWPHNGIDIEATMSMVLGNGGGLTSVNDLMALADEYGVGMMVGEIGIFVDAPDGISKYRYSDETINAYFTDVAETYEKYGIGWCAGSLTNEYGIMCAYPAIESAEYSTRENTDSYVDENMMAIFKSINGVE